MSIGPKSRNVWALSMEDRTERQLTDFKGRPGTLGGLGGGAFATDGEFLYLIWELNTADIWVMDVDGRVISAPY